MIDGLSGARVDDVRVEALADLARRGGSCRWWRPRGRAPARRAMGSVLSASSTRVGDVDRLRPRAADHQVAADVDDDRAHATAQPARHRRRDP